MHHCFQPSCRFTPSTHFVPVMPCPTAGGALSPGEALWCQAVQAGLWPPKSSGITWLLFAPKPVVPVRAGPAWQGCLVSGALTLAQILLQAVPDV